MKGLCDALKEPPGRNPEMSYHSPTCFRLGNLTREDDVETSFHTFKATAVAAGWSRPQWVTILWPYLTGSAQIVLKALPTQDLNNYDHIKTSILDQYEVTHDTQRQKFRVLRFKVGDRPKTLGMELQEYATQLFRPETPGKRLIVDKIVFWQVCYAVSPAVRTWLLRSGPTSLDQAAACLDNYFHAEKAGNWTGWTTPDLAMSKSTTTKAGFSDPALPRQFSMPSLYPSSVCIPPFHDHKGAGHGPSKVPWDTRLWD